MFSTFNTYLNPGKNEEKTPHNNKCFVKKNGIYVLYCGSIVSSSPKNIHGPT